VPRPQAVNDVNVYLINVGLPLKVMLPGIRVLCLPTGDDCELLIGMDIIGKGDFAVTNYKAKTKFTFRIPGVADLDFSKGDGNFSKRIRSGRKINRDQNCPCGSNLKFKQCHGAKTHWSGGTFVHANAPK